MADLTTTQREEFLIALAVWNGAQPTTPRAALIGLGSELVDMDLIVQTHETLADFTSSRGKPHQTVSTHAGTLNVWEGVQMAARKTRGTLFMMGFGGVAAAHFTGQA